MTAKAVMVLGTTSNAGKSFLTTALCRWYARQGLKVAPFKEGTGVERVGEEYDGIVLEGVEYAGAAKLGAA